MDDHEGSLRIEGDTIVDAFRHNVRRIPDRPALRTPGRRRVGDMSWADYGRAVAEVTAGLAELGIGPGQHVGIFSNNRAEWHLADLGALANGSVTVPVYQTSSAEQVAHILGHSEAVMCFVEDHELAGRILEVKDELPKLDRIVVFDERRPPRRPVRARLRPARARSVRLAWSASPDLFAARADAVLARAVSPRSCTRAARPARPKARWSTTPTSCGRSRAAVSLLHIGEASGCCRSFR